MRDNERQPVVAKRNGYSGVNLLFAFLGGAAAGAIVAILRAPRSGAETRAKLREVAEGSKETIARVPTAIKSASQAAHVAFQEALANGVSPH